MQNDVHKKEVKSQFNAASFSIPILVFIIPFVLYLLTLAPTYLPPDGAEFALCIQSVGVCHPTGFFLYILLGKLFTVLFPFGTLIYKVNLLSAIFASGTLLFSYLSLTKMGINKRTSFLVVLVYACSSSMWEFATSADVFTLATLLLSITLYFVITNRFYLAFLLGGILTSVFPNSIILLPVLLIYWKKFDEKSLKELSQGCLVYFAGLLFFVILLYMRMQQQPLIDWGHVSSLGDFYNYLTRQEFGGVFLIQTPQTLFSFANLFLQLWAYIEAMFVQFGFILPLVALFGIINAKLYKHSEVVFLFYSFILLFVINIFSLSSLNPQVNVNFQFDKFYLSSFTVLVLLLGVGLGKVKGATNRKYVIPGILLIIICIQLVVNFKPFNFSNDTLSQRLVNDSLSELPANAIAITLTNQNFFGAWYEQTSEQKYKNITILYFPNNVNTDYEKYHPELFSNSGTIQNAPLNNTTDATNQAILNLIAQNPIRPIFIWQGVYENGKFVTNPELASMLIPYGLWWKVSNSNPGNYSSINNSEQLLNKINYSEINTNDLNSVQRIEDLQSYAQALQSTSFALINWGKNGEALNLLNKANSIDSNPNLQKEIASLNEIQTLEPQIKTFIQQKDQNSLLQLAMDYYTVRDFNICISIFNDILIFDQKDPQMYSNIASMYSLENDNTLALKYYNMALQIDPTLSGAQNGKSRIEGGE